MGVRKRFGMITKFKKKDVREFAKLTNDLNSIHLSSEFAQRTIFKQPIVQGLLYGSIFGSLISKNLKNPVYLSQDITFIKPVYIDEAIYAEVVVESEEKVEGAHIVELKTGILKYNNFEKCVDGKAKVMLLNS